MVHFDNPSDPQLKRIHAKRLIDRSIDQMLGICEYAIQDGVIDQDESEAILNWLNNHKECLDTWPANVLYDRLRSMLEDNKLDSEEESELLGLLLQLCAPRNEQDGIIPSSLPINTPLPQIVIPENTFCFTGVFDFGSRADCQDAVIQRGGITTNGITKKLHYLVIGNIGSEVWKHSSFGNKIVKAVEYRNNGCSLAIVPESHWVKHLT